MSRFICTLFLFFLSNCIWAQYSIEWSKVYRDSANTCAIFDAEIDNFGNIVLFGNQYDLQTNDVDPLVLKYNPSGNIDFVWSLDYFFPNYDEKIISADLDSAGNIYLGANIASFPVDTGRFVKIDGITGQTVFNIPFIDAQIKDVLVDGDFVYILAGSPVNQLLKYDISGSNIWFIPLINPQSPLRIYKANNYVGVIGENLLSVTDSYFQFERYTFTGNFIDDFILNPTLIFDALIDFEIDDIGRLVFSSESYDASTNSVTYLHVLDSSTILYDTLIMGNTTSSHSRIGISDNNTSYLLTYTSAPPEYKIFKSNNNLQFVGSNDSAFSESNTLLGGDILIANNKVFTVNSKRNMFSDTDYEIACFDTIGSLQWNFSYSLNANSREKPLKLLSNANDLYVAGLQTDSILPIYGINLLKINIVTSINENPTPNDNIILFPNPSSSTELFFNTSLSNSQISIINITGSSIVDISNFEGDYLNLSNYAISSGYYILKIKSNTSEIFIKLIIL